MDEGEFPGGVDGEGSDREGGGRRSRKATDPPSLLPPLNRKQLSHLQSDPLPWGHETFSAVSIWFRHQTTRSVLRNLKSSEVRNVQTRPAIGVYSCLMRMFCKASGGEPFGRRRSASHLHDAGRADGDSGARFASVGSSGALGLPDPPTPESKIKWLGPAGSREEKQQRESSENKLSLCSSAGVGHRCPLKR